MLNGDDVPMDKHTTSDSVQSPDCVVSNSHFSKFHIHFFAGSYNCLVKNFLMKIPYLYSCTK